MSTVSGDGITGNSGADVERASDPRLGYTVADGIATIEIRRPEKLNALLPDMILAFSDLIERARRDAKVRAVVVRGQGSTFCAGDEVVVAGAAAGSGTDGTTEAAAACGSGAGSDTRGWNGAGKLSSPLTSAAGPVLENRSGDS